MMNVIFYHDDPLFVDYADCEDLLSAHRLVGGSIAILCHWSVNMPIMPFVDGYHWFKTYLSPLKVSGWYHRLKRRS